MEENKEPKRLPRLGWEDYNNHGISEISRVFRVVYNEVYSKGSSCNFYHHFRVYNRKFTNINPAKLLTEELKRFKDYLNVTKNKHRNRPSYTWLPGARMEE